MTAASFGNILKPNVDLKRKRHFDHDDDDSTNKIGLFSKRRNITQLPIRSPTRPFISVTPAIGHFSLHPGTLTPDSIPEEDVFRSNIEAERSPTRPHSNSNTSSTDSILVQVGSNSASNDDTEMDISSPKQTTRPLPTPVRIGRARSNDLISPIRSSLPVPQSPSRWAHDRIPTPMASTFPSLSPFESSFASAAARQMRPHLLSTSLSPMVDAESWTPQIQRPPSPGPEVDLEAAFDGDAMMDMDESNSTMNSSFRELSVHSSNMHTHRRPHLDPSSIDDTLHSSPIKSASYQTSWDSPVSNGQGHRGLGLDGTINDCLEEHPYEADPQYGSLRGHTRNQSSTGRTARLHMGYRADCDKCIARVPGHYSHIIWS